MGAETLDVITAIKLSDTDNVVVVGTDVNLLILLSDLSHHNNAHLCKPRAGDIYRREDWGQLIHPIPLLGNSLEVKMRATY